MRYQSVLGAALLAVCVLLAGCGASDAAQSGTQDVIAQEPTVADTTADAAPTAEPEPTAEPAQQPTAEPEPTARPAQEPTAEPEPTAESTASPVADAVGEAVFAADARPLTAEFSPLAPGVHRVDTLGTPFSFTSDETLFVQPNNNGFSVLTLPSSQGPDDRDIVFLRVSALSDPTNIGQFWETDTDGWPANDFAGWLDNLPDGFVVSNRQDTTLGGFDAIRVDLELGDYVCAGERYCALFATNYRTNIKGLAPNSRYRIWMVEQGDEEPIAVIVGIISEAHLDWFDTADRILSTVAFGDIAPNPVGLSRAGAVELPILGGVRAELTESEVFTLNDRGFYATISVDAGTTYLVNPRTRGNSEIESIDELVVALRNESVEVTEIEPTTVGGFDARVLELSGGSEGPILTFDGFPLGWLFEDQIGVAWAVEHPERGLLVLTAEAWGADPSVALAETRALVEELVATLEFVDLG